MQSYGFGGDSPHNYELDHLITLEVGGDPTSVQNLWPQPGYGTYNFYVKDKLENHLSEQICLGNISLSDAQNAIATNWIAALNPSGITATNNTNQADNFPGMPSFMTVEPNATQ